MTQLYRSAGSLNRPNSSAEPVKKFCLRYEFYRPSRPIMRGTRKTKRKICMWTEMRARACALTPRGVSPRRSFFYPGSTHRPENNIRTLRLCLPTFFVKPAWAGCWCQRQIHDRLLRSRAQPGLGRRDYRGANNRPTTAVSYA